MQLRPHTTHDSPRSPSFGKAALQFFRFAPEGIFINHGSYGSVPRAVSSAQQELLARIDEDPDKYFRRDFRPLLSSARLLAAELIKAPPDEVCFVENASSGVNAVLRSLQFQPTDGIVYLSIEYGMDVRTMQYVSSLSGAKIYEVQLSLPMPQSTIISLVRQTLESVVKEGIKPKLLVFDEIASTPAVRLPVEEFVALAKSFGTLTLVDAAHVVGQIDIDVKKMDVDFYVTNLHKWNYAARGTAILFVKQELQHLIHPTVISFGYLSNSFQEEFSYTGTRDYSPYLTLPAAVAFRKSIGGEVAICDYTSSLVKSASTLLVLNWSTIELYTPGLSMSNIALPLKVKSTSSPSEAVSEIMDALKDIYRIWAVIFFHADKLWTRISAQIYNEISDYERLSFCILEMKSKGGKHFE